MDDEDFQLLCFAHKFGRFNFRASRSKWRWWGLDRTMKAVFTQQAGQKAAGLRESGGLGLRSRENSGALRCWAGSLFSWVGQVALRNFLLDLLQLMILVNFFVDYGSEHLRTTSEKSSEDDEEGCKASGRWRVKTNALRALVSSWKVNGWWRFSTSVLRT